MEPKVALWRRVSTDTHYIISKEYGGVYLVGTQNEDKINELFDYIVNSSQYKGRFKCMDPSDLSIVEHTKGVYDRIENKHFILQIILFINFFIVSLQYENSI